MTDAFGNPVPFGAATSVRYRPWFQILGLVPNSILLASPVFDDITLYYDHGAPELLYMLVVPIATAA